MEQKKYFTKYLPVEGEIEAGAVVYDKYLREILIHDQQAEWVKGNRVPVKLFLCSRDIQVGDKVHLRKERYTQGGYLILEEEDIPKYRDTGAFKVIGEISPDALRFVKVGVVFEESDIKVLVYDGEPEGENHVFTFSPAAQSIAICQREGRKLIAYFKCPCCGTFK